MSYAWNLLKFLFSHIKRVKIVIESETDEINESEFQGDEERKISQRDDEFDLLIVEAGLHTWERETINSIKFDPNSLLIDPWLVLDRLKLSSFDEFIPKFEKIPQDYQILALCTPEDYIVMENNVSKLQRDIETEENV